jgi:hypothetical protein
LELELQCTEMVGIGATVYRDGWNWSYSVQRWLELELQCTEMVGVGDTINRDNNIQRWLELQYTVILYSIQR